MFLIANIVTTSKAPVTTSVALAGADFGPSVLRRGWGPTVVLPMAIEYLPSVVAV